MKAGFIIGSILLTASMSALALPSSDIPDTENMTRPAHSVQDVLNEVGYALDENKARVIKASSADLDVQRQLLPPGGQCEGYKARPGCVITYNDGSFCTEYCGLFEEVCRCVY
ncbi:MAG: hypothetical protein GYB49_01025 [Alphaproteobacteria bacterium]|nr:hypothetical protein [Alphaproteobacteria bacterium]|tara:strand:+ start:3987 stop:4325 length:339 start_codon:yes stop_codon:yes gene_type:complete